MYVNDGRKINYVMCCWSGPRRHLDPRRDADPPILLRTHIAALQHYRHHLEQITIVVPHNPDEPPAYREFLTNCIPQTIQMARVVIIERPNIGLSYGSLSDTFMQYRSEFDYYFLVEDDYIFVQHDFDKLHIQIMEQDRTCGYVCGLAWDGFNSPLHAGISNGLMRTAALEKVWAARGIIPHVQGTDYKDTEREGQVGQSQAIIAQGYSLKDWGGRYKVGFRLPDYTIIYFHRNDLPAMMLPI